MLVRYCLRILIALTAIALLGCSGPSSEEDNSVSSPQGVSDVDPSFFTWQQSRPYSGDRSDIATTVYAVTYYSALMFRNNARSRTELKSVTTDHTFAEYRGTSEHIYPDVRGPQVLRLISISVDKNESSATATWCANRADQEIRKRGSDRWIASYANAPYSAYTSKFIKSSQSPTGWRESHVTQRTISNNDCAKAFKNDDPAIKRVGEPQIAFPS